MIGLDPKDTFERLREEAVRALETHFPVEGKRKTLRLSNIEIPEAGDIDAVTDQKEAKLKGRTWGVPIKADIELIDNQTGKVVDKQNMSIGTLPKPTNRFSYIVGGKERQIHNQLRLKSGVYTAEDRTGDISQKWNLAKGLGFDMKFEPESRKFKIKYNTKSYPAYPVLKALGVDDDTIERQWGKEVFQANQVSPKVFDSSVKDLHKRLTNKTAENQIEAMKGLREVYSNTVLRPDSTKLTLGKPLTTVDGSALMTGTQRLLDVNRGVAAPDERDNIQYKDIIGPEDLLAERLETKAKYDIQRKLKRKIDSADSIKKVVTPDTFGKTITSFFESSSLAELPKQLNPIDFLSGARKTTVFGEGGISSDRMFGLSGQSIHPSHMGFLDPIQTPESSRIGGILQMTLGTRKQGKELQTLVYNTRTKKKEWINSETANKSVVAFPDQYTWDGDRPTPIGQDVRVMDRDNEVRSVSAKTPDYILASSKGMFDFAANSIPFLQNNQGNRTQVAAKQLEQAISLSEREAPLVQNKTNSEFTFENVLGALNSHRSKVDGKVVNIDRDGMDILGSDNKKHRIQLYSDFPLNDNKSAINSTPLVKVGDAVKAGQVVADTSFTKDGTLALGKNLEVSYIPYRGYNFEDGIVISEGAAKKLTSEHMSRHSAEVGDTTFLDKKQFLAMTAGQYTNDQAGKLDDDGVIKPGMKVLPGDPLIARLRKTESSRELQQLQRFSKKSFSPIKPQPVTWDADYEGEVVDVVKRGKEVAVHVKSKSPAVIGDKLVGRHGNKGIITKIIPDNEMPHKEDGTVVDVLLNPTGLPTRINMGQALETAAAKIAQKTGKPYVVDNFNPKIKDYTEKVMQDLKANGLKDKETIIDPITGSKFETLTGPQYILKLEHTAEKGVSARNFGSYDSNFQPKGGGKESGATMDSGGLYALLAHGSKENIREFQALKGQKNDDYWISLKNGEVPPPPGIPFAYEKFTSYLKAMGVDVQKNGNKVIPGPMTDDQVLALSNGRITRPDIPLKHNSNSEIRPEKGSLFDPKVTGTTSVLSGLGDKWGHIALEKRLPNPTFEKPITTLLDLKQKDYSDVIYGKRDLNGKRGPEAIVDGLKNINVKSELERLNSEVVNLKGKKRSDAIKKIKYLRALNDLNLDAQKAYTLQNVPVLPPIMRPVTVLDSGAIQTDDVTELYRQIGTINTKVKEFKDEGIPEDLDESRELTGSLYDGLKALNLTGMEYKNRHRKGIMELIAGSSGTNVTAPKDAFFQNKVIGKRQDLSTRGVIVPEPSLGVDEIAIPEKSAIKVFEPFVIRRMRQMGYGMGEALKEVKKNTDLSKRILELEMEKRPVWVKRDPVLHKYGVQAFKPKITKGSAVKIHPLATSGYNADFDGDKMGLFLPVSQKAIDEAWKSTPSQNLFSSSHGGLMFQPGHESLLGLHQLSLYENKHSGKAFKTEADAVKAYNKGQISMTDVIDIRNPGAPVFDNPLSLKIKEASSNTTTLGRILISQALPEEQRSKFTGQELNKANLNKLLSSIAKDSKDPGEFSRVVDKLKDMGNEYATGFGFGLEDLVAKKKERDVVMAQAKKEEIQIRNTIKNKEKRDEKIVELYGNVKKILDAKVKPQFDNSNNRMYQWVKSNARGDWDQFRQMTVSPIQVVDSYEKPLPFGIDKSYSEGLDTAGYWASMYGARKGTIGRVKGTQEPGALVKEMMQTSMDQLVTKEDCGTKKGIRFSPDDYNAVDRVLADDVTLGVKAGKDKGTIKAGESITPELLTRLKNNGVKDFTARTPLKCEAHEGVCSRCFGLNEKGSFAAPGENLGVKAAHALGEPLTQMAMNCNAAGNTVLANAGGEIFVATMEQLWEFVRSPVDSDLGVETKIPLGLEVWDHNSFTPVHLMQRHMPDDDMVFVQTESGRAFITQANHPNWARKEIIQCPSCDDTEPKVFVGHYKDGLHTTTKCSACDTRIKTTRERYEAQQEVVVQSKELEGLYVGVSVNVPPESEVAPPLDPYLLGFSLAEGNVRQVRYDSAPKPGSKRRQSSPYGTHWKTLSYCITQLEGSIRDRVKSLIEDLGLNYSEPSAKTLQINDVEFARKMWAWTGSLSHKKRLPPTFMSWSQEDKLQVLAGLIDGDGSVVDGGAVLYSTSWSLIAQTQQMAQSLGIKARIRKCSKRDMENHPCFSLYLKTSLKIPSEKEVPLSKDSAIIAGYERVVSVSLIDYQDWTYDLSTETKAFTACGIRTHNSFHTGGVAGAKGSNTADEFTRVTQLVKFPDKLPGAAKLAVASGVVDNIVKDKVGGGWKVFVDGKLHHLNARQMPVVRKGQQIRKGDALTAGPKNPNEMLPLTGIDSVRSYVTDELANLGGYKKTPIMKRNAEVFVRALTNAAEVQDPGDHPSLLWGDSVKASEVQNFNSNIKPGQRPVVIKPVLKGTNVLPMTIQEDWIAKLQYQKLKDTILDAAAVSKPSNVHGSHPVPGMAFGSEFGFGTPEKPWSY